ncbi:MAG: sensor histidine kinase [Elainellaceae cyanobacterium]
MIDVNDLRQVKGFSQLGDEMLKWLVQESREVWLEPGQVFRQEGDPAEHVFILLDGEYWITQRVGNEEVLLKAVFGKELFGEVPIIMGVDYFWASGHARTRCHLLEMPNDIFWKLLGLCSCLATTIVRTATERIQDVQILAQHRENLISLGTMAAGLAHELNNPAAASRQAARQIRDLFPRIQTLTLEITRKAMTTDQQTFLAQLQREAIARIRHAPVLDPITQSDREDDVTDWLDAHGVPNGWQLAPTLVSAGLETTWLNEIATQMPDHCLTSILTWLESILAGAGLLEQLHQSTRRIANLVDAVQDYSEQDDLAPTHEINVHDGLESTLTILHHKLKRGVTVMREYDETVPRIQSYGTELNQVWTNLIDNAIDATEAQFSSASSSEARHHAAALTIPDPWQSSMPHPAIACAENSPTVWIRTRCLGDQIVVEISDNGVGIPSELQAHIFEPFFTTKDIGKGMGVGLQIVNRIVQRHQGDIRVASMPGNTCFQVCLPVRMMQVTSAA